MDRKSQDEQFGRLLMLKNIENRKHIITELIDNNGFVTYLIRELEGLDGPDGLKDRYRKLKSHINQFNDYIYNLLDKLDNDEIIELYNYYQSDFKKRIYDAKGSQGAVVTVSTVNDLIFN